MIRLFFTASSLSICHLSQREIDRRSFPEFTLRPNPAAVPADDSFDNSEPDSHSLKLFFGMETQKRQKHLFYISWIEPSAVVFMETLTKTGWIQRESQ
jgi:hypothetical protein